MEPKLLFRTLHGSRPYGLHHALQNILATGRFNPQDFATTLALEQQGLAR